MKKLALLMLPFLILGAMAAAGCGKTPEETPPFPVQSITWT